MITDANSGALFDPDVNLATNADLIAEGLTDAHPVSYSVFRTTSTLYYSTTSESTPVEGFQNVEVDPDCLISPDDVVEGELDYNFSFTPNARASFPFALPGVYFVDFTIYPKEGAAIVWRTWVTVQ